MALGRTEPILVLDGIPALPALDALPPDACFRAESALMAAALLTRIHPNSLLVSPAVSWHRAFVRSLPLNHCLVVLAVGSDSTPAAFADEWIRPDCSADELVARIELARKRERICQGAKPWYMDAQQRRSNTAHLGNHRHDGFR